MVNSATFLLAPTQPRLKKAASPPSSARQRARRPMMGGPKRHETAGGKVQAIAHARPLGWVPDQATSRTSRVIGLRVFWVLLVGWNGPIAYRPIMPYLGSLCKRREASVLPLSLLVGWAMMGDGSMCKAFRGSEVGGRSNRPNSGGLRKPSKVVVNLSKPKDLGVLGTAESLLPELPGVDSYAPYLEVVMIHHLLCWSNELCLDFHPHPPTRLRVRGLGRALCCG